MRTSLLAFVALAVSVSLSATAASQEAGAVSTAAGVELPVDARELLASASQVSLAADTDTLVVRLTAMRAADTTTAKTDAQLREQAQILFKLYKVLNPKAVAAMGKTETEQFETFYKTVFQQILARVESDKTSSGTTTTTTSAPGTSPGTTPSTGSGSTPGATPSTSSGTTPATGTTSAPSPGSTTTPGSTATPGSVSTARYSAVTTTDPTPIAESLSFFTQVYDPTLAQNVRALQDNSNNLEAIVQSTKTTSSSDPGSDPANQFQAPTVLDGVDEGPTTLDGRRLANASNETYGNVQLLFCDVGGNAIWKWKHTPYTDDPINTTTQVNIFTPKQICEAPQLLEVKVTAYQSGCSRQNHPEGCDNVYWKGCGGLTVNPNSDRIVVARTGGRSLGLLYYKKKGDQCQGRVVDAIKTYKGKKFNSISYAEYAPSGNLYFTDSPFGLAKGPEDYEGDILDKSPLRELPFNGVFLLKNTSKKVELIECAMDRPNKIAFSPKGDVMYITNSRKGNSYVKKFNLTANGEVRKSSLFFNFTAHPELETDKGYADGIKTDSEGNVYVAAYKGIYIFSPKGDLIGNLRSNQEVSGIALGGGRLFLTGAFGVVAQSTGIKPAATLPFAKTDCAA